MNAAQDLHRLLDRALGDDPLDALTATRHLTDDVTGWLTDRAVLNSRRAGKSWMQIARILRTTKQSTHRRFRHLDHLTSLRDVPRPTRRSTAAAETERRVEHIMNRGRADREFETWHAHDDVVPW